jgi:hypothetical protein
MITNFQHAGVFSPFDVWPHLMCGQRETISHTEHKALKKRCPNLQNICVNNLGRTLENCKMKMLSKKKPQIKFMKIAGQPPSLITTNKEDACFEDRATRLADNTNALFQKNRAEQ